MVGLVQSLTAALEEGRTYELSVGKVRLTFFGISHVRLSVRGEVGRAPASYDLWNAEQVDAALIRARYRLCKGAYAASDELSALHLVGEVYRG